MIKVTYNFPKDLGLTPQQIEDIAIEAVNATADAIEEDYHATMETFDHKPKVNKEPAKNIGGTVTSSVWIDDLIYSVLNYGSTHQVGKGGKWMSFYTGYSPKTRPGIIGSGASKYSGTVRQRAKGPWTITIEPRRFDISIASFRRDYLATMTAKLLLKTRRIP